jgi:hypothetical protein
LSCCVQPSKSAFCPAVFYNAVSGFFRFIHVQKIQLKLTSTARFD